MFRPTNLPPPNLHSAGRLHKVTSSAAEPASTSTTSTTPAATASPTAPTSVVVAAVALPHFKVAISRTIEKVHVVAAELSGLVRERQREPLQRGWLHVVNVHRLPEKKTRNHTTKTHEV